MAPKTTKKTTRRRTASKKLTKAQQQSRKELSAIILFALNNHLSVTDTNELLDSYQLPLLN